ncbi:hypothetical protein HYE68_011166 [Fusarium pseudograminearum]|nr:hypothetical protein HYE68_011166 [Fusarium pseudograminearum]
MSSSVRSVISQPPHPHLKLLDHEVEKTSTIKSVPIFTHNIEEKLPKTERPDQYGLLASNTSGLGSSSRPASSTEQLKSRLFYNVAAPTSTFICGSQGSGKSHTLGTILENCLISSKANHLLRPLAGLVFHYDTFVSDTGGTPCEAALFLEREPTIGRVVALDEAHKYMNDSSDSQTLTESLLSVIRLQRHLGTRVILSTQEPTVSPKLLDLCSTVIVHRFTSPTWFATLKRHLAGVYLVSEADSKICNREMVNSTNAEKNNDVLGSFSRLNVKDEDLFSHIVGLETGEALLFCPSALIDIRATGACNSKSSLIQLGSSAMKVHIRKRITADGGQSVMAN